MSDERKRIIRAAVTIREHHSCIHTVCDDCPFQLVDRALDEESTCHDVDIYILAYNYLADCSEEELLEALV